ncbi:MAG: PhoPQ-activated protein PqaA family protein [Candidatus Entotheonellia bacterium]
MPKVIVQRILLVWLVALAGTSMALADLTNYVQADDEAYRWAHLSQTDRPDGITVHELQLTSQVWQGIVWQHRLRILTPTPLRSMPALVLLIISDSGDGERELREGVVMAGAIGAPVALLQDIPNQPLFGGLVEDDLLAHTLRRVRERTLDTAGWP